MKRLIDVPRDLAANCKWRKDILLQGQQDEAAAQDLFRLFARDPIAFINSAGYTYDPRISGPNIRPDIPMILWDFQEDALQRIIESIDEGKDLVIEKSRDMGASWLITYALTWKWLFHPMQAFLMGSRKEEYVDKRGDLKSLMPKVDFILKRLPSWLKPRTDRRLLHLKNLDNGSTIDGESTTGDFARGGRWGCIMLDEFAAVENGHEILKASADATPCRIFNSTPQGIGNAFYDMRQSCPNLLRMHWTAHPHKAKGLYRDEDDKPRSPWYDAQCDRRASEVEIAQELDINYRGADHQFFDAPMIQDHIKKHVMEPFHVGDLDFDTQSLQPLGFHKNPDGYLKLWMELTAAGKPLEEQKFVVGVDISEGRGSSNSVISIADAETHRKVGEWIHSRYQPSDLADLTVALCRWLNGAFLIWESNGPGENYGDQIVDSGYDNFYFRQNDNSISRKTTDIPGWFSNEKTKDKLFKSYRRAFQSGLYVNPSREACMETAAYIINMKGKVVHAQSQSKVDPTGARERHGDICVADALTWWVMKAIIHEEEVKPAIPHNSFMGRRMERLREEEAAKWW